MDYKAAGVDIDAKMETLRRIRGDARSTFTSGVLSDIGSFGGLFRLEPGRFTDPVLVSSADGVGTKLKVAFLANRHDTVGGDLVNHCVNDILVQGAEPLFFMDYLATGRIEPSVAEAVIGGVARACRDNGCALLGGETAEMPGFYHEGEYDIAGFIVGVVERERLIMGGSITPGDVLLGVPSTGLHTNGYSLAREILFNQLGRRIEVRTDGMRGTLGDELLRTHTLYLPLIRKVRTHLKIKGIAHITGGGLMDNIPRVLPEGLDAEIQLGTWTVSPLFQLLASAARIKNEELHQVFNMGIGMVLIVAAKDTEKTIQLTRGKIIGKIVKGNRQVVLKEPVKKSLKK